MLRRRRYLALFRFGGVRVPASRSGSGWLPRPGSEHDGKPLRRCAVGPEPLPRWFQQHRLALEKNSADGERRRFGHPQPRVDPDALAAVRLGRNCMSRSATGLGSPAHIRTSAAAVGRKSRAAACALQAHPRGSSKPLGTLKCKRAWRSRAVAQRLLHPKAAAGSAVVDIPGFHRCRARCRSCGCRRRCGSGQPVTGAGTLSARNGKRLENDLLVDRNAVLIRTVVFGRNCTRTSNRGVHGKRRTSVPARFTGSGFNTLVNIGTIKPASGQRLGAALAGSTCYAARCGRPRLPPRRLCGHAR